MKHSIMVLAWAMRAYPSPGRQKQEKSARLQPAWTTEGARAAVRAMDSEISFQTRRKKKRRGKKAD